MIWSAIAATIFVLVFGGAGGWLQSGYYQEAANSAAKYERRAHDEIGARCASLVPVSKLECSREAQQSAHENERSEYDLYAQRTSALWAGIMAIAALVGIGLSGVGIYLVWTTFAETKRANEIAGEMGMAQVRGYISVRPGFMSFDADTGCLNANFFIKNSGQSPARRSEIHFKVEIRQGAVTIYSADTFSSLGDVSGGGEEEERTIQIAPPDEVLNEQGWSIYFSGSTNYTDVFKTDWSDEFDFWVPVVSDFREGRKIHAVPEMMKG